jgi:hypothetical protein
VRVGIRVVILREEKKVEKHSALWVAVMDYEISDMDTSLNGHR